MRRGWLLGVTFCALAVPCASASAAPTITEFSTGLSTGGPVEMTAGPDGNVWFTEGASGGAIGRITPSGTITEFTSGLKSPPQHITRGPDGNLWFTETADPGRIGRITPSGTITELTSGLTANSKPWGIAAGPDGNVWFTESGGSARIGRITPLGTITEFTTGLTANSKPLGIVAGPDGNLWFAENGDPGRIGRITPSGAITELTGLTTNSGPQGIAAGPDGNLWFTETKPGTGAIGDITTTGTVSEFSSGLSYGAAAAIVPGDDGNLYATESANHGAIAQITPSGTITEETTGLTLNSRPEGITAGPDGNVWFAENGGGGGRIGRLTVAPGIASESTSAVTVQSATLSAGIEDNSQSTTYYFQWGSTTVYGSQTSSSPAGSASGTSSVSASIGGLQPSTLYHYRVVAINPAGTSYGVDQAFTAATPPGVSGAAAAPGPGSAQLSANVNPQGLDTTYHFEWGTTTAYGNQVPSTDADVGADSSAHAVSQTVSGLTPSTTYYFRIVASDCGGCVAGTIAAPGSFTTGSGPTASTLAPAGVGPFGATLQGTANPQGASTTYHLQWGTSTAYGSQVPASDQTVGSDSSSHALSQPLSGLTPATTYHYRMVATDCGGCVAGTTYGGDQSFTTPGRPVVTPGGASAIGLTDAIVSATVNPQTLDTTYHFEWGASIAYGQQGPTPDRDAGSDGADHPVSLAVSGLSAGTTYHYRVVATSAAGTTYGPDGTFTTQLAPFAATGSAGGVSATGATVTGTLDPRGMPATYYFDYGTSSAYGASSTESLALSTLDAAQPAVALLSGLAPSTVYHYRLVASDCGGCAAGTVYGDDATFTTAAAGSAPSVGSGTLPPPASRAGGPPAVPVLGRTELAQLLSGVVTARTPGSTSFVALAGAVELPQGSVIDASAGALRLTVALDTRRTQSATLWSGAFSIRQRAGGHGMTDILLTGGSFAGCRRPVAANRRALAARSSSSRHSAVRGLWSSDNHGRFSTYGRDSVATVRGTSWETVDRCDGTMTLVRAGKVSVRPRGARRAVLVTAGHSFLARRR